MKIARIMTKTGEELVGFLEADGGLRVFEGGLFGDHRLTGRIAPPDEIMRFLAPVQPPNVFAIGLNYRKHAQETNMALPNEPVIFLKATTSVIGPQEAIRVPREAPEEVDYEAELALVIGKPTRHVPMDQAGEYILGYTCANDVTARDCQGRRDRQWARAKSFDTFCPLGPVIVTDLNPSNLAITSRLNGNVMQSGQTDDLIFNVPCLVSFLSRCFTLLPGTVVLTGTPAGVGVARTPPVFLRPGDVIEIEVEGIGVLRNPIMAES